MVLLYKSDYHHCRSKMSYLSSKVNFMKGYGQVYTISIVGWLVQRTMKKAVVLVSLAPLFTRCIEVFDK